MRSNQIRKHTEACAVVGTPFQVQVISHCFLVKVSFKRHGSSPVVMLVQHNNLINIDRMKLCTCSGKLSTRKYEFTNDYDCLLYSNSKIPLMSKLSDAD